MTPKKKILTLADEEHLKKFVSQIHKDPKQLYYGRENSSIERLGEYNLTKPNFTKVHTDLDVNGNISSPA